MPGCPPPWPLTMRTPLRLAARKQRGEGDGVIAWHKVLTSEDAQALRMTADARGGGAMLPPVPKVRAGLARPGDVGCRGGVRAGAGPRRPRLTESAAAPAAWCRRFGAASWGPRPVWGAGSRALPSALTPGPGATAALGNCPSTACRTGDATAAAALREAPYSPGKAWARDPLCTPWYMHAAAATGARVQRRGLPVGAGVGHHAAGRRHKGRNLPLQASGLAGRLEGRWLCIGPGQEDRGVDVHPGRLPPQLNELGEPSSLQ